MLPLIAAFSSLMEGAQKKKEQERAMAEQLRRDAAQTEVGASNALSSGQANAFQSLMNSFGKALGR